MLILGAGIAGMVAAMELRDAGYKVQVLEYNGRSGGRNWSLYGGDTYTELGGATQHVQFDPGQYINPGPWRLPYHHHGILHYANRLGVALGALHPGQLQRLCPFHRGLWRQAASAIARCRPTSTAMSPSCWPNPPSRRRWTRRSPRRTGRSCWRRCEDWGALDANYEYVKGRQLRTGAGSMVDPGGGLNSRAGAIPSRTALSDVLQVLICGPRSAAGHNYEMQSSIFQPKGGMGQIGKAFGKELGPLIKYNCKVIDIHQDDKGVTATYIDSRTGGEAAQRHRRLVRLHHPRLDPQPDPDECRRPR